MGKKCFNAEAQLVKHGWTKGSGLGINEDGIKEALKVKLKFDQAGVGHKEGDEFTYHWWDHVFNKAARNIKVNTSQDGVQIETDGNLGTISSKRPVNTDKKDMLYGMFVKSSKLTSEGEMKQEKVEISANLSEDSESESEDTGTLSNLTDEQLMKICEGRTAHKGARHGLHLSGKLARIAAQESQYTTGSLSSKPSASAPNKSQPADSLLTPDNFQPDATKLVKKKHRKRILDQTNDTSPTEKSTEHLQKSKKRKKHKEKDMVNDDTANSKTKKERKRKHVGCQDNGINEGNDKESNNEMTDISKSKESKRHATKEKLHRKKRSKKYN